jgi:hypothetical protein
VADDEYVRCDGPEHGKLAIRDGGAADFERAFIDSAESPRLAPGPYGRGQRLCSGVQAIKSIRA